MFTKHKAVTVNWHYLLPGCHKRTENPVFKFSGEQICSVCMLQAMRTVQCIGVADSM